jgi:predicted MPP superfamily phosphohydrolase
VRVCFVFILIAKHFYQSIKWYNYYYLIKYKFDRQSLFHLSFLFTLTEVFVLNKVEKITIRKYKYTSPNVPADFEGVRIIFLSDIHFSRTFPLDHLKGLFELTNGLSPDMILMGGDYVTKDPDLIAPFFEEAKTLTAPLGVYGVLGNHDRRTDAQLSEQAMRQSGITLLDNFAVWIKKGGSRIRVGGVGDLTTGTQNIEPMLKGTEKNDLMILVTHHPDYAEQLLPEDRIDLMFCGHTHGGQISFMGKWIPPWPGSAKLKYLTGVIKQGCTTVIVSNGIGTIGPPIRIFAAPQIWEVTLSKGAAANRITKI